jgi:RHS repeat-associated protein
MARQSIRRLCLCLLVLVADISGRAQAQTIAGEPGAGIPESGSLSLANALAAVALDPSTGVLTASLPIETPAARGGTQTGLALTYNSAAGIREAGVGWGLNVPSIERRNRDGAPQYHDPSISTLVTDWEGTINTFATEAMDEFFFDGKLLIPICLVNRWGACIAKRYDFFYQRSFETLVSQASPLPAWATEGWMYFRLEADDTRARFFWSPDQLTWRVQFVGGEILELGVPLTRPQLVVDLADEAVDYDAVRVNDQPVTRHALRWNAVRRYDEHRRSGFPDNLIAYQWKRMGHLGRGYLIDVWDTPPANAHDILVSADFAHHVRLTWQEPPFLRGLAVPGFRAPPDLLLVRIDVTSQPFVRRTRQLLRRYHLGYVMEGNRHYVTTYETEGRCAPIDELRDGSLPATQCRRLPATRLRYSQRERATRTGAIVLPGWGPHPQGKPIPVTVLDVNGDSLPDFLETKGSNTQVASQRLFLNGSAFAPAATILGHPNLFSPVGRTVTGNTNLVTNGPASVLWHATSASFKGAARLSPWETWGGAAIVTPRELGDGSWTWFLSVDNLEPYAGWFQSPDNPVPASVVGDVEGDGLPDAVYFRDGLATPASGSPPDWQSNGDTTTLSLGAWTRFYDYRPSLHVRSCFGPSPGTVSEMAWENDGHAAAPASLVDMNGDGLDDLAFITLERKRSNRLFLGVSYWPGDGRGNFTACTDDACACTSSGRETPSVQFTAFEITTDARPDEVALSDVNGDGLADLVFATPEGVNIYWNADGRYWGSLTEPTLSLPAAQVSANWQANWPPTIQFADMNGNGLTDVVFIVGDEIDFLDIQNFSQLSGYGPSTPPAWAPRPGLLIGIDNGLGASTDVQYISTTDLARTKGTPRHPWTTPQAMQVVKTVTVRSGFPGDERRTVTYDYDNPVFDGEERRFRGFRNVSASHVVGSGVVRIDDTYFMGEGNAKSRTPLLIASEVSDGRGRYHSTKAFSYRVQDVMPGAFGIDIKWPLVTHPPRMVYLESSDTILYDTAAWSPSDGTTPVTVAWKGDESLWRGTVPVRSRSNARIRMEQRVDDYGNVVWHVDRGQIKDDGGAIDKPIERTVVMNAPRGDWKFLPASVTVAPFRGSFLPRQRRLEYDALGRLWKVYATLTGTLSLQRFHEDPLKKVAERPKSASRDGEILLALTEYDDFGNITIVEGPNGHCALTEFDSDYASLPQNNVVFTEGCGKGPVKNEMRWDRGFDTAIFSSSADGSSSRVELDDFGRVVATYASDPETGAPAPLFSSRIDYQVTEGGPVQRVKIESSEGPGKTHTTWRYLDSLGRDVLTLEQADPSAGDEGRWVGSGLPRRGGGLVTASYEPWFYSGDPANHPLAPPATKRTEFEHDPFGRVSAVQALDGGLLHERIYRALGVEDIDPDGSVKATKLNGHGRIVQSTVQASGDALSTSFEYEVDGQIASVVQWHSAGSSVVRRRFEHDSLGRMVLNIEPNTSIAPANALSTAEVHAWRYAYDDAGQLVGTSDARGCGENIAYDGLGRVISEDLSPCLSSQDDYSPERAEVLNWYDTLENGQTSDFGVNASYLKGRLAGTRDRGAHTRFGYDARGRVVSIARQIARPALTLAPATGYPDLWRRLLWLVLFVALSFLLPLGWSLRYSHPRALPWKRRSGLLGAMLAGGALAYAACGPTPPPSLRGLDESTYEAHWSRTSREYDDADRIIQETTGAEVLELLGLSGDSVVTTDYTLRGALHSIGGSYGPLLVGEVQAADGLTISTQYADAARTSTAFGYDDRRRLSRLTLSRATAGPWVSAPSYTPPAAVSSTLQRVLLDNTFHYDVAGNPDRIDDKRTAAEWSAGFTPVTRQAAYDAGDRLARVDYTYAAGSDAQVDPLARERASGRSPVPASVTPNRVAWQTFDYDWLGNLTRIEDDGSLFFDRSLGTVAYGTVTEGPNQIRGAGPHLSATHDAAGNLTDLLVQRFGPCTDVAGCIQRFHYDWDEIGQLARARRWDFTTVDDLPAYPALPPGSPAADLRYFYDGSGTRVLKTALAGSGDIYYTAEIFPSLRLEHASWDADSERYTRTPTTEAVYLAGLARVVHGPTLPSVTGSAQHVFLLLADHLGSTTAVIDRDSGELVERTSQQVYGAADSDYRPERWDGFREPYQFTGKEEDFEVGLTYFGARYYQTALARFASPDPLTIHALGAAANPYGYVSGSPLAKIDPDGLDECGADCGVLPPPPSDQSAPSGPPFIEKPANPSDPAPGPSPRVGGPRDPPRNPTGAAPTAASVVTKGLAWAAKAWFASNPFIDKTFEAVNDPISAAKSYAKAQQDLLLGPVGRLANAVLVPAVVGGVTGKGVAIDTGEVATIVVETGIDLVTMGRGSGVVGAEARMVAAEVTETAAKTYCFAGGTPIATYDGNRPIETIHTGDEVLSRAEPSGELSFQRVVRTFVTPAQAVLEVVLSSAEVHDRLLVTPGHPFFVSGIGWLSAEALEHGMTIPTVSGQSVVQSVRALSERQTVYNFEVEGTHTYFVGQLSSLVHNACRFGGLTQAAKYGIKAYGQLRQAIAGNGLQAHHLFEKRFASKLGQARGQMLALAVTAAEHQRFTNRWRQLIPYGSGTRNATVQQIRAAARNVYAGYPAILKALGL